MIKARSIIALSLVLLAACAGERLSPGSASMAPNIAPDTIPADIMDGADPEYGIPLDIVTITFRVGIPKEEKQRIIRSINGWVIGGVRINARVGVDGAYLVRIPKTDGIVALDRVIQSLRSRPEVVSAAMFTELDSPDATIPSVSP